jgi:tyrosyl-tRNA synthetase
MATTTGTDVLHELSWRGQLAHLANEDALRERLARGGASVYAGFDPTADSLHIGSLVPLLTLARFQRAGHRPIALVGGGTGLIGDPSGKAGERTLNSAEIVAEYAAAFYPQIEHVLDFEARDNPAVIVDNHEWLGTLGAIELLRDVGKHFPMNVMLSKETVRARLEGGGISFTEFSYMVLQSYDFLQLSRTRDCFLQVGGSDQFGNITAGVELIRRVDGHTASALCFPLVTKADGTKFGKTEEGTIWLDSKRTSPFAFFQFWVNADDAEAVPWLRTFTFLDAGEIEELSALQSERPERRDAQRRLAIEVTTLVHGEQQCRVAMDITEALFGRGDIASLDATQLERALEEAPSMRIDPAVETPTYTALLAGTGLAQSNGEAARLIKGGGIYANDARVSDPHARPEAGDFIDGRLLVLRKGRRSHALVLRG